VPCWLVSWPVDAGERETGMSFSNSFHEVRFPTDLALGATGGPVRSTEVITLGSGREQRNTRWANSRRRYNVGYGVKTIDDLHRVLEFFEERRGRLFGFRFRDPMDFRSSAPGQNFSAIDQVLGVGDGDKIRFPLTKTYGSGEAVYTRRISKPVLASLIVAVDGEIQSPDNYHFNPETGEIVFPESAVPQEGKTITAGYEFDVPVRFDTDEISVNLSHFDAGDIPSIPLMELLT